MPRRSARSLAAASAPAVFVLLWSTGFIGAKYGLPYAEPFSFLGLRLLVAAVLLAGLALATGSPRPHSPAQYARSAISGLLLHTAYLGGVFWAIDHGFPAGVAAVVVSLQPVFVAVLGRGVLGERLSALAWLGLVLGIVGVVLVLAPGLSAGGLSAAGLVSCLVALAGGTLGTLHQKRYGDGIPLLSGTAVQYAAAASVLLVAAAATESRSIHWTREFGLAFSWLVLGLSLGAVLLLLYLLRRGSAAGVSSLFYLVPPATALEAHLAFGEDLARLSILGIAVTTIGVALVVRTPGAVNRG